MAAAPELLKFFSRKRKAEQEFLGNQYRLKEEVAKKRFRREMEFETEASQPAVMSAIVITKSDRNERGPDELRNGNWWSDGYQNWDEESFKKRLRVSRDTFEFILSEIKDLIVKEPTRMKPHPTPPATQLALCLYRLAHGCTFLTVGDLFGLQNQLLTSFSKTFVRPLWDVCMTDSFTYQEIYKSGVKNWKIFWEIGSFLVLGRGMGFMFT